MAIEKFKPNMIQAPLPEPGKPDLRIVYPEKEDSPYDADRRDDCYYEDDEPSELDVTINDVSERGASAYSEAETISPEGVSMSMGQYYANREEMVRAVAGANSRRGFVGKNDTTEGLSETYSRYGSDTPDVVAGANRKVSQIQDEIDELFLAEELVAAGFPVEEVKSASKGMTEELTETFTTNSGMSEEEKKIITNSRVREYRHLKKKHKEHDIDA